MFPFETMNSLYSIQLYLVQHPLLCLLKHTLVCFWKSYLLPASNPEPSGKEPVPGSRPPLWLVLWEPHVLRGPAKASSWPPRFPKASVFIAISFSPSQRLRRHRTESRRSGVQKWGLAMLLPDETVRERHRLSGRESEQTPDVMKNREAWHAAVHGVTKRRMPLSDWIPATTKVLNLSNFS